VGLALQELLFGQPLSAVGAVDDFVAHLGRITALFYL
jgi:hypothetical protein